MKDLKAKLKLDQIISDVNIAKRLHKDDLNDIAQEVLSTYTLDKASRTIWESLAEKALDLAKLTHEQKDYPWPGASNVKYPVVATAVMQFVARQMPELIKNGRVVKAAVKGEDSLGAKEQIAERISKHMSYQLLYEMPEWEDDLDKLLHMLATIGTVFKKTYFDPMKKRPVSLTCDPMQIFIHNDVKVLEDARRITHQYSLHKNDLVAGARRGIFLKLEDAELDRETLASEQHDYIHEILEQHRWLDLDGDGYEEPYVVTVDKDLEKVLRIVARWDEDGVTINDKKKVEEIKQVQYFTDYHFLRSPDGGFWSLGYGQLMFSLAHSINTILNQLVDAGTLANTQSGIISKSLRLKAGKQPFQQGEFVTAATSSIDNIHNHIYQMQFKEPSNVLFQLLGLLISATKELSSITDALMGKEQVQNVAATSLLAQIEQGTKVLSAIQKRLYRAMKKEFEKLYRLNKLFLDREVKYLSASDSGSVRQSDYEDAEIDICPVADPNVASTTMRLARMQEMMKIIELPGVDIHELLTRYLKELDTPNIEKILPPKDPNASPPPEQLKLQAELQQIGDELTIKKQSADEHAKDVLIRAHLAEANIAKIDADTQLVLANKDKVVAEIQALAVQPLIDYYKQQVDQLQVEATIQKDIGDPETRTSDADREAMGVPMPPPPEEPEVM